MTPSLEQEIVIALGSNLGSTAGSPTATIAAALLALNSAGARLRRVSRFYATPCFPEGAGPDYVNACAVLTGLGSPAQALDLLHQIESDFDRQRIARWGSRTLDLDLLAIGDIVLPDRQGFAHWHDLPAADQRRVAPDQLILPHPRLHERAFVLVPMCDVAPDWRHPVLGLTTAQMTARLPGALTSGVVPL
ncbi:2-amino-4-hydroxy-6-hydroxymethyldihydropteridine diphosphokinase [Tropicibacter oceani]|uniref:2-amino-4-hydroxy-6-hydroxymethyldihydropteridine pyrophosphokinase n=1 Tax=Tropicibacter oceani TaxID=3058420 RepID=A0ABY8QJY6_9RHOB|nr:2-amino-4-hydroxy-6-hydroxymethyldihydropteridine diphosphokinase [Tropicibacter oceani]WGW04946.1 2-amino-4-hydroxy-6-hydroxymethyldihydropteridine diphosphokinase [Tropicibacter oceani]